MALEVCARNNGGAALNGTVGQIGDRYLLTLTATTCTDGQVLAAEKAEVAKRDDLLPALDSMIGKIRGRLGESAASVSQFNVPMLQRRTSSFDALAAYSQANYDFNHGKRVEAIPLLQHAIELDPKFAAAYSDLAVIYDNIHEPDRSFAAIKKAYELRDMAGAHEKFAIALRYIAFGSRDILKEIDTLRNWTQVYPNDAAAWANLSNAENWLAMYPQAVADGRQAAALEPDVEVGYTVLARALLHSGQYAQAQAVCDKAIAHHVDGDDLHGVMFHDAAGSRKAYEQFFVDWKDADPGLPLLDQARREYDALPH